MSIAVAAREPLRGGMLVVATIGLGLATFSQTLDLSVANVSLPQIAGALGTPAHNASWVITAFAAANAFVLPLTGWLARRFGEVRLFVVCSLLFSLVSFLCGLAWNLSSLVILRIFHGGVAGVLTPLSQSLLLQTYPPERRGLAMGLWASVVLAGPLIGPIIGGWLTDNYGWPWIFFFVVPFSFMAGMLTWVTLSGRDTPITRTRLDWVGLISLLIGIGLLQSLFDKGNDLDWFNSDIIVAMAVLSAVGLIFFLIWNSFSDAPLIDFSLFRNRTFVVATLLSSFGFFTTFGSLITLPLWLQTFQGYTPLMAGLTLAPLGIPPVILFPILGRYINRIDLRLMAGVSFIIMAGSFVIYSNFTPQVSMSDIVTARLIQGLGFAFYFLPFLTLAISGLPHDKVASASGIFNFFRLLIGAGLGTAVWITAYTRRQIFHHQRIVEAASATPYHLDQAFNIFHPLSPAASKALVESQITSQAYLYGLVELYWVFALLMLALIPLLWLVKLPKKSSL
jgi:MFS transporter, DHA2 family, multidrug resistance protein